MAVVSFISPGKLAVRIHEIKNVYKIGHIVDMR